MKFTIIFLFIFSNLYSQTITKRIFLNKNNNIDVNYNNSFYLNNENYLVALNVNQKYTKILNFNLKNFDTNWEQDFLNEDTLFKDNPSPFIGKIIKNDEQNYSFYNLTEYANFIEAYNIKKCTFTLDGINKTSSVFFDSLNVVTGSVFDVNMIENNLYATTREFTNNNYIYKYDLNCNFLDTFHIKQINKSELFAYLSLMKNENHIYIDGLYFDENNNKYKYFLVQCNSMFELQWIKEFEIKNINLFSKNELVIKNNNIYLIYNDRALDKQYITNIIKLDIFGNVLKNNQIVDKNFSNIYKFVLNSENDLICGGVKSYTTKPTFINDSLNNYLLKLDSNFNTEWEYIWGNDTLYDAVYGIQEFTSGKYAIFSHSNYNVELLILDENISSIEKSEKFNVFPNPSSDFIRIENDLEIKNIEIIDLMGNSSIISITDKIINIEKLNKGIYQIIITDINNNLHICKFIKN